MGNNHQRGDGELPHESTDQDWSLLGPCRPMAGEATIIRKKAGVGVSPKLKCDQIMTKRDTVQWTVSMDGAMA